MILACGVDLIEIDRVRGAILHHGERFLKRVFTPAELSVCQQRVESLAARFAAKEATAKALGCGIGDVGWQEIEILRNTYNAPGLHLYGEAARIANIRGLAQWSVSLSHSRQHAIALIIALGIEDSGNSELSTQTKNTAS
jgi:holo-[acyl-carrier protein] synthase